jgi:formate--tetrahydrofolate ligase
LKLADYAVTEAGFGADLGAEKFLDIKCRMADLKPSAVVLVATVRALKFHGGVAKEELNQENLAALEKGFANLERHLHNIQHHYGLPCIVSINHFTFDTDAEIQWLKQACEKLGAKCVISRHWAEGGAGAEDLAREIIDIAENREPAFNFVYDSTLPLWNKIEAIATKLYGATSISASPKVMNDIKSLQARYGDFPVCMAKTQMSFSTNPNAKGAPTGHNVEISEVRLANGAGFIVAIAGDMMTMPGLPKTPAAERIDISDDGVISGLF